MNREDLIAPDHYNIVSEIEKYAADPKKKALIWQDETGKTKDITYASLIKHANQIGNAFLASGLKKGDKLLIMIPRLIEAYEVYLAALKTGIIIIPSSDMLTTKDLQYRVSHGEVSGVVSYYPCVDAYQGIKEYDKLKRFVIGEPVPGWEFLDEMKETISDELEIANTSSDDIAFYRIHQEQRDVQRGLCIPMHGDMPT